MFKVAWKGLVPKGSWTKGLKNQPYDVIKTRERRREVGKKAPKIEMDNLSFL